MNNIQLIPKIIHYVWVGGNEKPKLVQKCIQSWRNILPEYEIKEWNENNFDIYINKYASQAYEMKKYAFVSDYIRFYVLYHYGGIYMDTDVEVIKSLEPLLQNKGFAGFENDRGVAPGLIMASVRKSIIIKKLLDSYENRSFINPDGTLNTTTVVKYATEIFEKAGFTMNGKHQSIDDFYIYPSEYFCPINYVTGEIKITSNTFTIHHYAESWLSKQSKLKNKTRKLAIKIIGFEYFEMFKKAIRRWFY